MDIILERIEEHILDYILFHHGKEKINSPKDILNAVEEDALEDIKDRMWDLIKYELCINNIFDEIERRKELEQSDEEEEGEIVTEESEEED
jgi:hypothetical protein